MDPITLITAGTAIWRAFKGEKEDELTGRIVKTGKGLVKSKTANAQHASLVVKFGAVIGGVALMPSDWSWLVWPALLAVFAEWGVNLYLRAITREPVN